jgi:hypothetical protein
MYADDGILHSDKPFTPTPPRGFEFAEDKSRWIRSDQGTVDEIKFLGVKYDFRTEKLKGSTRNGSTLEFGLEQEDLLNYLTQIVPGGYGNQMEALARSGVFGLALSKLYGGKFGKLDYEENVTYKRSSY